MLNRLGLIIVGLLVSGCGQQHEAAATQSVTPIQINPIPVRQDEVVHNHTPTTLPALVNGKPATPPVRLWKRPPKNIEPVSPPKPLVAPTTSLPYHEPTTDVSMASTGCPVPSILHIPVRVIDSLPKRSLEHLPQLVCEVRKQWADYQHPWVFAGQTEQETCPSLQSPKCWNPPTELKTDREYGVGLGLLGATVNPQC